MNKREEERVDVSDSRGRIAAPPRGTTWILRGGSERSVPAQVLSEDSRETKATFMVEDGTGAVEVTLWLNDAADEESVLRQRLAKMRPGTRVRRADTRSFDESRAATASIGRGDRARGAAAAATWTFRGDGSRRRCSELDRVRGGRTREGGSVAGSIGARSTPPRPRRGPSVETASAETKPVRADALGSRASSPSFRRDAGPAEIRTARAGTSSSTASPRSTTARCSSRPTT